MAFKIIAAEFRILSGSDRKVGKWCDHLSGSEKKVRNWDLHLGEPPLIDYHLDNRLRPHETALRHVKAYKLSMKPSTLEYTYLAEIKIRSHVCASKKRGIKICLSTLWTCVNFAPRAPKFFIHIHGVNSVSVLWNKGLGRAEQSRISISDKHNAVLLCWSCRPFWVIFLFGYLN